MKLVIVLMLCAIAAAAANLETPKEKVLTAESFSSAIQIIQGPQRNILINALVRQLIAYVRRVINDGSPMFGIPPLDPLELDSYHLYIPAGIINLDLELKDLFCTGFGGFVVHTSTLNLSEMYFDLTISIPALEIKAGSYDLTGDLFTALPLYGKGEASFDVEAFELTARLYLKQSEDGTSVLLDRIENADFLVSNFKSNLTGMIGGGNIDSIVNAVVEDVIVDYVNRFKGIISHVASHVVIAVGNPVLDQLDTWKFIAPFV